MIKKLLFFLPILTNICFAQSDTLHNKSSITEIALPSFQLEAFQFKADWISSPSNAEFIDSSYFKQQHQLSPQLSLNSLPGVRFESRGIDGSRRISIRGSSLRSPFGVRNVKVYWNGIPITSPDGSTGMEIIDVSLISSMEVLRGPGASVYGAGMGGVLMVKSIPSQKSILFSSTVGSWGTHKENMLFNYVSNKWKIQLGAVHSSTNGYREQEFNNKKQYSFIGGYNITKNQQLHLFVNTYKGSWGLPGALDSLQETENPRQAVDFANENNTRVDRNRWRIGVGHTWKTKTLEITNSLYWNTTTKENPYGTSLFFNGYKQEKGSGTGGRSSINWNKQIKQFQFGVVVGGEYQFDHNLVDEYELKNTQQGRLNYSINTNAIAYVGFLDTRIKYKGWLLTFGGSYNQLTYKTSNKTVDIQNNINAFDPILAPRIGLLKSIHSFSVFTSYSKGYSPPTVWDLGVTDTLMNHVLQPEIGENIEAGLKFKYHEKIKTSVTIFQLTTQNAIVSKQLASSIFEFSNAGFTQQLGIEYLTQLNLEKNQWKLWTSLAYTFSKYKFTDYENEGEDYSGNDFPGIPNHRMVVNTSIQSPFGVYVSGNLTYEGAVYLNNENTFRTSPYYLLSSKVGYEKRIAEKIAVNIYGLVENITNTTYSSFLQLNGVRGKYYNPSATQSFYGGITLTLHL